MKEAEKVVRRSDFDLSQNIFVEHTEKTGDVYI